MIDELIQERRPANTRPLPPSTTSAGKNFASEALLGRLAVGEDGPLGRPIPATLAWAIEGRTHNRCREREAAVLLERLTERPQLLVLAVGVDDDAFDQAVEIISHAVARYAVNPRQRLNRARPTPGYYRSLSVNLRCRAGRRPPVP